MAGTVSVRATVLGPGESLVPVEVANGADTAPSTSGGMRADLGDTCGVPSSSMALENSSAAGPCSGPVSLG